MRLIVLACGPMNLLGAVSFSPPFPDGRTALGLAEAPPFYLWVIASWILVFGIAYFWQGLTGKADRTFLAVGAVGKASFAVLLIGLTVQGDIKPLAIAAALPDLVLAIVFLGWLIRHRNKGSAASVQ